MTRLAAIALMTVILLPGVAFAGSSTDAALGLGAFAVFNQILGGVGVVYALPQPVYLVPRPVYGYRQYAYRHGPERYGRWDRHDRDR
jgi:hypothetical protein